jgi:hypothetical protein
MAFKLDDDPLKDMDKQSRVLNFGKVGTASAFQQKLKQGFETEDCRFGVLCWSAWSMDHLCKDGLATTSTDFDCHRLWGAGVLFDTTGFLTYVLLLRR